MKRRDLILLACAGAAVAATALASETINYTYDARGRLVKVVRSGTVNNNVSATYAYDKADNRTNVNVVSPNAP
jgi:YD repeat-containing protein